jgi:AraC-type DNA-binding domain-containing proteins
MPPRKQSSPPNGRLHLEPYFNKLKSPDSYLAGIHTHKALLPKNLLVFFHLRRDLLEATPRRRFHHHRYVLTIPVKDAGRIVVNNKEFILNPGCAFLIAPHQIHWFNPEETKNLELLFITSECENAELLSALNNINIQIDKTSRQHLVRLLKSYTSGSPYDDFRNSEIHLFASLLLNSLLRTASATLPKSARDLTEEIPLIDHINQTINQRMTANLSHATLAASLHCSVGHLRKRFRSTYGISLGDYITTLRLQRAKTLLLQSRLLVKEIAFECGFVSNSSFNRFFLRTLGCTPLDYRRIHGKPSQESSE